MLNFRSRFQMRAQHDEIRSRLIVKREQNDLIESTSQWLMKTKDPLDSLRSQPVSIQYDAATNRLKDFSNEFQEKISQIRQIILIDVDDSLFIDFHRRVLAELEIQYENIRKFINDREQIQIKGLKVDEKLSAIEFDLKTLRNQVELYRIGIHQIDFLQVDFFLEKFRRSNFLRFQTIEQQTEKEENQLKIIEGNLSNFQNDLNERDRHQYQNKIR